MIVTVQGPRPKNILDLIHETIITLIKDSFQGVDYDKINSIETKINDESVNKNMKHAILNHG
jgi:type III secretory pathway lipoprotein EscJ